MIQKPTSGKVGAAMDNTVGKPMGLAVGVIVALWVGTAVGGKFARPHRWQ